MTVGLKLGVLAFTPKGVCTMEERKAGFTADPPLKTENVFTGKPDERQGGDIPVSRFRPRYRALTIEEKHLHDKIKAKAAELEDLFRQAHDLACALPEAPPVGSFEITQVGDVANMVGEFLTVSPFSLDPKFGYFDDGLKSLELAVMWTVKGLTS